MTWCLILASLALMAQVGILYPNRVAGDGYLSSPESRQSARVILGLSLILVVTACWMHPQKDLALVALFLSLGLGGAGVSLIRPLGGRVVSVLGLLAMLCCLVIGASQC